MKALAVDLGGGHFTCAVVEDRSIAGWVSIAVDGTGGFAPLLPAIERALKGVLDETGNQTRHCTGLAFSFCGLVDSERSRILSTNAKYEDAPDIDLAAWCLRAFDLPLRIENDARLALLGEWYAGAARGFDDVVMLTLGTGIGGAAMMGGRLLRGHHSQAGCLGGHLPVSFEGRRCTCGAIGCAEAEASSIVVAGICRETPGFPESTLTRESRITHEALFRHAALGDRVAILIRDRCLRVWGAVLVAHIHAYDPDIIVLGGGVMQSAATILPSMQTYVNCHAWTPWGKVSVRAAALGTQAALLGAIPLLAPQETR